MSLADMLIGRESPFGSWASNNSNFLTALGAGIGSGQNIQSGLSNALQMIPQANQLDMEAQRQKVADAKVLAQTNSTLAYLQREFPDIAQRVEAGMPIGEAWNEANERLKPKSARPPIEVNGQLIDPDTFEVLGDFRTPEQPKAPAMPTSYQEFELAQKNPAYAATLSSSSTKPPTEGERRNQQLAMVIKPELETVERNWAALTNGSDQMIGSDVGGNRPGLAFTSPEYQQAINSLSTIVASYLYSVSGATATDEEIKRQVNLLTPKLGESQQSANQKLDRIRTYAAAVQEAAGRAANTPGRAAAPLVGNQTSTGVTWSVEP